MANRQPDAAILSCHCKQRVPFPPSSSCTVRVTTRQVPRRHGRATAAQPHQSLHVRVHSQCDRRRGHSA
eukprot:4770952-Prymnesium_polylepis.4